MICTNPTCNNEVPQPDHASQVKIYCTRECRDADLRRYMWHTNEGKRLNALKREAAGDMYRSVESCEEDPLLPIEQAYVNYCMRCLPNAPTYDFEDWYDIHLTFGPIDW